MTRRVLVDPADRYLLEEHSFAVHEHGDGLFYASTKVGGRTVYLHRLIMGEPPGKKVDHVNGNGLDNRRLNLRIATHKQNLCNQRAQRGRSSRYKGVSYYKSRGVWEAYIKVDGKKRRLGYFKREREAALAYDIAAEEAWGEFARLNFANSSRKAA